MKAQQVMIICVFIIFAIYGYVVFYIYSHAFLDSAKKSDAIIILGARVGKNSNDNPCLTARITHGIDLYHKHLANYVIVSGGQTWRDQQNEASVMKDLTLQKGLPTSQLIIENKSYNTYENLLFSKQLLAEKNLHSMIIVTDAYHSPRAALIAQKLGISYTVSPVTNDRCVKGKIGWFSALVYEPFGILLYKITGKI